MIITLPLVSIIIRTCQRPNVLRRALDSIRKQKYQNIQVVIVEDGENVSEGFIRREYSDLNYLYQATKVKVGRCVAGNKAMEMATGEYFNFLDDDDELFPEHIETLLGELVMQKNKLVAYSVAEEQQIDIISKEPYEIKIKKKHIRYKQPFNRMLLYTFNYLPIQCVMFHRSLYEELGGFDEKLEALEDWDLWVRYSTYTDYHYVNQVTSCYRVPYKVKDKKARKEDMNNYLEVLYNKFDKYSLTLQVGSINKEMKYVIREYKTKGIIKYTRMFFRILFLGER